MNKRKMKKIDRKIKYAIYKNYDNPVEFNEGKLTVKAIPSYISNCKATKEELEQKLQCIKRDMKRVNFTIKHSSMIMAFNIANILAILLGMKLATEDYLETIKRKN